MRFILKERIFSLRESYYIRDDNNNNAFEVTGRLIGFREKLKLRDLSGNTLATITEKMISLRPVYSISRPNQPDAKVKKDFINMLRDGFSVNLDDGLPDLRIQGNILEHNYTMEQDGKVVAQVSKKWISLRDSYVVDVSDGEDAVLIVACAIVVDRITHEDE